MTLFDDGKDAGALRTIGEVSAALGIRTHVLRYWEEQFSGLKPLKRAGGRRLYRPEDVALIERIDRLVNHEGYTLKGAKAALKGSQAGRDGVEPAPTQRQDDRGDLLSRLKAIRAELATALAA
jgi:DNA-binding transcriptional MerR regulator